MKYQDKVDSMENKYYTPDITEFHVGFEYERKTSFGWVKSIFIEPLFNNSKIGQGSGADKKEWFSFEKRVKYLYKEDIESLGFAQVIEDQYTLDDIELLIDDDLFVQIIKDDGFLFQGTIKNKSELKKVLKMIGHEN